MTTRSKSEQRLLFLFPGPATVEANRSLFGNRYAPSCSGNDVHKDIISNFTNLTGATEWLIQHTGAEQICFFSLNQNQYRCNISDVSQTIFPVIMFVSVKLRGTDFQKHSTIIIRCSSWYKICQPTGTGSREQRNTRWGLMGWLANKTWTCNAFQLSNFTFLAIRCSLVLWH